MPGGNRTGPTGQGPMTGRGAGYCGGNQTAGSAMAGQQGLGGGGQGRGRGRGGRGRGGRGRRNLFNATGLTGWQRAEAGEQAFGEPVTEAAPQETSHQVEQDEVAVLKDQAADLSRSLQEIQSRLAELEKQAEGSATTESAGD